MEDIQVAKIQCNRRDFRIIKRGDDFRIINIWREIREDGVHEHKYLIIKCTTISEALMRVAQYMK